MTWFDVSKDGLSKIVVRRGSHWILGELLQNAWDAPGVSKVVVNVTPVGRNRTEIVVEDDSPVGFDDLSHAFTLFAESGKKADPSLRGRFNLGEKLVLALCDEAEIVTTKGTVSFSPKGRRRLRHARARGTSFRGVLRLNSVQAEEAIRAVRRFITPDGVTTIVNGVELRRRVPLMRFSCVLPTEIADEEGVLKRTRRKVEVSLYRPPAGESGTVFEMGIPVSETGDLFDVDIGQKVPLSLERDTLLPSFLRDLRVAIVNNALDLIDDSELASEWVGEALGAEGIDLDAVGKIITRRFGQQVVSFDVRDREANDRAVSAGYVVLHGRSFSKAQWANVKASGIVKPAGRVMPTHNAFGRNRREPEYVTPTPAMRRFAAFVKELARAIADVEIDVEFLKSFNAIAAYGGRMMVFNVSYLGSEWFEGPLRPEQTSVVIHELAHEFELNHLSSRYHDALTRLAGKAVSLALDDPGLFDLSRYEGHDCATARC